MFVEGIDIFFPQFQFETPPSSKKSLRFFEKFNKNKVVRLKLS
jgi:hypothetical protein